VPIILIICSDDANFPIHEEFKFFNWIEVIKNHLQFPTKGFKWYVKVR